MDLYLTSPVGPFATAIGASFGTFTTKQDVSPTPAPIILPNQLRLGSKLEIKAEGEFSTTGTPTLLIGLFCGAPGASGAPTLTTTFADSGVITTATATAFPWRIEYRGIITTIGTSGQIVGQGALDLGTSLIAFATSTVPITSALRTVTLNTTIAQAVGVAAAYGASSASNTIRVHNLSVLILN